MKKILSIVLAALVMVAPFTVAVSAENFVPSISYKPAPMLVGELDDDGRTVIGVVTDADGNAVSTEYHECIVITPVSEAEESEDIPEEAADLLLSVYSEIAGKDFKLSSLSEALNKKVESDIGEGKNADDLIVKDLFDVTVLCDELKESLAPIGNTLTLTFKVSVEKDVPVYVMTYKNGQWAPIVNVVNNNDGTISCTFEDFCPVAFFVPASTEVNPPQTGDNTETIIWAVVMISAISLIVALVAVNRKKAKTPAL